MNIRVKKGILDSEKIYFIIHDVALNNFNLSKPNNNGF